MDLPVPFTGWRYDVERETLHTPAGYKCTPEQIEAALWLTGILRHEAAGKRIMYADTPLVEPRPRIYHWSDFDAKIHLGIKRRTIPATTATNIDVEPWDRVPQSSSE